uniref:Uncharacterized protein n=1 Tax=Myotis myotis TaxID=51298 RepID=A0A7J7XHZ8_MYOMY|nr:hypothetical protein mMyoMyo1_011824 [Myotis myotis]
MKHKEKQKHLEGRHFIKTARMSRGPCSIQEDTPQHQTSAEAPARNQAAGDRIDISKPFICVLSPPTHPCLDKDGPCNTQDKAPLPKSPLEAPASGQAAGKKSAFCKPPTCVFSPPKPCREIRVYGKTPLDEDAKLNSGDALQHRHMAVAPTQRQKIWKASSTESFASISSKDKQNDAGHRISQDNVPQPDSPVEAPACSQAAGEKTAFSEHPIGVSTPFKHIRLDEDGSVVEATENTENSGREPKEISGEQRSV